MLEESFAVGQSHTHAVKQLVMNMNAAARA